MAKGPSYAQMERMIEFMEENPQLAKGQMRSVVGRYEARLKWEELSSILNSIEGLKKNPRQWSRFWADKKYDVRKRLVPQCNATANCQHHSHDVDGPPPLSHLDDRIMHLVADQESDLDSSISPAMSTKASQTTASPMLRRSSRIRGRRLRSQFIQERQRLINIEDRRVKAETMQAAGWRVTARALNELAKAVVQCGQIIADAMVTGHN